MSSDPPESRRPETGRRPETADGREQTDGINGKGGKTALSLRKLIHTLEAEGLPCVRFTHIDAVLWQILNKLAENPETGLNPERTEADVLLNGKPLSEIDPDKLPAEQK